MLVSGVEWIGEIPKNWKVAQVKQLFEIGRGRVIAKDELIYTKDNGYPVYSSQTKNNGVLGYIGSFDYNTPQLTWTTDGANAGTVFLRQGKYNCTNVCGTLKLKRTNIHLKYIYYALFIGAPFYKRKDINGYKIMNNEMAIIKVPIPNYQEQKFIAEKLDEQTTTIDKLIYETKQSIEELRKYKQSIITEIVTKGLDSNAKLKDSGINSFGKIPVHWKTDKIRNLFSLNKGLTITKSDLKEEGIPVISYGEIHSKYGFRFDLKKHPVMNVDEKYLETNKDAIIKQGDFIFADTSEDIEGSGNFTCYVSDGLCFAGYHTVVLKPKNKINYNYFAYLFDSLAFRSQIQQQVQGIKVYSITQRILKPLQIVLPSQQEQEEIVNYLDKQMESLNKLIKDKSLFIEELVQYKKSLIYEYVTGKKQV